MSDVFAADNPRAVAGSNEAPDYAREVTDRMAADYAATAQTVTELLTEARGLPKEVNDDETAGLVANVIRRMRDVFGRLEAFRQKEKEPYMRGAQAVDQYFFGLEEKIEKRKKTDKDGAIDVLSARVHAHNQRKLAEERRRRDEEARIAREAEETARRAAEAAERESREAEEKAARARKAENVEAQQQAAREADERARAAREAEDAAREARRDADADARANAADMVRTRHDGGTMTTMRQVPYVEITDSMELDAKALWPFVKDEHKLMALKAWAKVTQHKKQMAGAIIEFRDDTVIR